MAKKIVRKPVDEPVLDKEHVTQIVNEYRKHKDLLTATTKRVDGFKKELNEIVTAFGKPDEKGHLWVEFDDIELKRERRVSKSFNASAAEIWAKQNGHWDLVKVIVPATEALSEDLLLNLGWNNEEIQEIIPTFYVESETWALKA